jgi:hypothetical protein
MLGIFVLIIIAWSIIGKRFKGLDLEHLEARRYHHAGTGSEGNTLK